jgi:hypothetical protein
MYSPISEPYMCDIQFSHTYILYNLSTRMCIKIYPQQCALQCTHANVPYNLATLMCTATYSRSRALNFIYTICPTICSHFYITKFTHIHELYNFTFSFWNPQNLILLQNSTTFQIHPQNSLLETKHNQVIFWTLIF